MRRGDQRTFLQTQARKLGREEREREAILTNRARSTHALLRDPAESTNRARCTLVSTKLGEGRSWANVADDKACLVVRGSSRGANCTDRTGGLRSVEGHRTLGAVGACLLSGE